MFNIKEMILSAIIKRGIVYDGRNCDINVDIPTDDNKTIKVNFKAEHMTLKILTEKDE